jgi:hypothetical protein
MSVELFSPFDTISISRNADLADLVAKDEFIFNSMNSELGQFFNSKKDVWETKVKGHRFKVEAPHVKRLSFLAIDGSLKIEINTTFACVVSILGAVAAYPQFEEGALMIFDRMSKISQKGYLQAYYDISAERKLLSEFLELAELGANDEEDLKKYLDARIAKAVEQIRNNQQSQVICEVTESSNLSLDERVKRQIELEFFERDGTLRVD